MNKLIFPTLDLFVYQLRNGLGDNDEQIATNHTQFWQNLPDKIHVGLERELEADNPQYTKLLELLEESIKKQSNISDNHYNFKYDIDKCNPYNLQGYYYPVRLDDTYGLLFDCSVDDLVNPQPISCFSNLAKQGTEEKGNIGKSWMISGVIPPDNQANLETLAKVAYKSLNNRECQNLEIGKFLGAKLFEAWKPPQKLQQIETENIHVLVILYPDLMVMKEAASFYGYWLRLLCSRNKIIWEYAYSQQITRELQSEFKSILDKVKTVKNINYPNPKKKLSPKQLKTLQEILTTSIGSLSEYVKKLSYLEILILAIKTNLNNYQKYLEDIEKKAKEKQLQDSKIGDTDLSCLKDFSEIVQQKYQAQVTQDYASLNASLRIVEDLINTVRGIVEIEQTKSDRQLNNTIAIAGVGLATSSLGSAVILAQKPNDYKQHIGYIGFRAEVFVLSLGIGAIAIILTMIIISIYRYFRS
ncbi:hypothetical protein [Calothrix rhizosoleniae]|uniref:hypothetical protein n=1 Tax=Calothrix rhizosoleniae TaxID=888997 RepID=UPI000B4A305A|nr:hypothetical protein [Calothrix rhizosoleniae]